MVTEVEVTEAEVTEVEVDLAADFAVALAADFAVALLVVVTEVVVTEAVVTEAALVAVDHHTVALVAVDHPAEAPATSFVVSTPTATGCSTRQNPKVEPRCFWIALWAHYRASI